MSLVIREARFEVLLVDGWDFEADEVRGCGAIQYGCRSFEGAREAADRLGSLVALGLHLPFAHVVVTGPDGRFLYSPTLCAPKAVAV